MTYKKNGVEIMPWCPKCKAEYREGMTVCSDCKVDLVSELPDDTNYLPFFQSDMKPFADRLKKYFEYSGLKSKVSYDEELEVYVLSIPEEKQKQAKKLYQAFYFVERERIDQEAKNPHPVRTENKETEEPEPNQAAQAADTLKDATKALEMTADIDNAVTETDEALAETDEIVTAEPTGESAGEYPEVTDADTETVSYGTDPLNSDTGASENGAGNMGASEDFDEEYEDEDEAPEDRIRHEYGTYVMKADQYKDYNATVWVFLITGIIGVIFVGLNVVGILTILNGVLPNLVMGALFLFFIYVGLSTNKKAKKLQLEIDDENKLTDNINQWLKDNITDEYLSSIHDVDKSEELNYIIKTEIIKNRLLEEFGDQNRSYLDRLIEEYYNVNFDDV